MDRKTNREKMRELTKFSQNGDDDALCAEIEQIKDECQFYRSLIESHLHKGCRIPPICEDQWQEATENYSPALEIFSGCPINNQQLNTKSSNAKLKKSKNVPSENGLKDPYFINLSSTTRKKNQKNVTQHEPTSADIIPKTVTIFDVSQNGPLLHRPITSKEINDQTDINIYTMTKPSNVSTPGKRACTTDVTVNGADASDQSLQNPHYHRQQSTYVTNELNQCENVTNKTETNSRDASCGQVSNSNYQPLSIQSVSYTPDNAVDDKMASDNREKLQFSAQVVGGDRQTSDIIISLAETPVFYHNPQQNNLYHCIQITSVPTTGTRHSRAVSSTYTAPNAQIVRTEQNQQLKSPLQMANMHRQSDSTATTHERVCVGNQVFLNISQQKHLQDLPQAPTALTPSKSVSTSAEPYREESEVFRVVHIDSREPVLRYSTQTASLSGLSVLEPGVAAVYQGSAQNRQFTGLYMAGPDTAASRQYPLNRDYLTVLTVTQPDNATSRQPPAQKQTHASGLPLTQRNLIRSSQYHPRVAQLPGLAETQPYIATISQPSQIAQFPGLPESQPDIATSNQHLAQQAQRCSISLNQPHKATASQHLGQKAQRSGLYVTQPHVASSTQQFAQRSQCLPLKLPDKAVPTQNPAQKYQLSVMQPHIATSNQAMSKNLSQTLQQFSDSTVTECSYCSPFIGSPSTGPQIQETLRSTSKSTAPCQNVQGDTAEYRMSQASCTSSPSPVRTQIFQHIDSSTVRSQRSHHAVLSTVRSQNSHHAVPPTIMSQTSHIAVPSTVMSQTPDNAVPPTVMSQTSYLAVPSTVMSETSHLGVPSTVMPQTSHLAVQPTVMSQTSHHAVPSTVMSQTSDNAVPSTVISQTAYLAVPSAVNTDYNDAMYETPSPTLLDHWFDNSSQ